MSDEMFRDLFFSNPFRDSGFGDSETARNFGVSNEILGTPMSSCGSLSSSDAGAEEDGSGKEKEKAMKDMEDGGESSKAAGKAKKKETEPRFAFMTKTEIDHLEDGYRWRKYGQKAVKNSIFPRSYYRCTTPNCGVKKRVERSFQDPSIVITTYEGQHNHPIAAMLRGNLSAAAAFPPSMLAPMPVVGGAGFLPKPLSDPSGNSQVVGGDGYVYSQSSFGYPYNEQQSEYGVLQDIFPSPSSFFNRQS
ncbi:probable WRKY transcription factor 28 [Cucurbita moschata]|uniref:Probable WRKY transcription factor 28 n=1 Tax=Cucurbita moschata TaxID=3662 RepID=A0A6J1EM69_CUCMO|nr:probable WRKY transcription factor 28 [Cucurbita moschata]